MVYTVDVDVPAAEMYRNFTGIGYWEDLVAFYRANAAETEIAHFATGDSGTDVAFSHILSARDLPPIARPVLPGTFVITREQHFDPFDEATNSARGHYRAIVPAVPVQVTGEYTLLRTHTKIKRPTFWLELAGAEPRFSSLKPLNSPTVMTSLNLKLLWPRSVPAHDVV